MIYTTGIFCKGGSYVGSGEDCIIWSFMTCITGILVLRELDNWGVEKTA